MSIGKYLTNAGVIGAVIGAVGTYKQTREMPQDWRRYLVWVVWLAGLALALAGVAKQHDDEEHEAALKAERKQEKIDAKAARRRK